MSDRMTFEEWLSKAFIEAKTGKWLHRPGESVFNTLEKYRPDLAEIVRNTPIDPFHVSGKLPKFLEFVGNNWDEEEVLADFFDRDEDGFVDDGVGWRQKRIEEDELDELYELRELAEICDFCGMPEDHHHPGAKDFETRPRQEGKKEELKADKKMLEDYLQQQRRVLKIDIKDIGDAIAEDRYNAEALRQERKRRGLEFDKS